MKSSNLKTAACLLAALSISTVAMAQSAANLGDDLTPEHFAQLDRNKDGRISRSEYEQFMRESFEKLDKDGDRKLSPAETRDVLTPEQFTAVDKNADGKISLDEFLNHVMRDFDQHDYNKDGKLQP